MRVIIMMGEVIRCNKRPSVIWRSFKTKGHLGKEVMATMLVNRLKSFKIQLLPSVLMMTDSNAGGSMPVKFILLLVVILIAALVMEYFL
jgi:hypothetical protein